MGSPVVDKLATELFRAGFVKPRFFRSSRWGTDAIARRGAVDPPAQRDLVLSVVVPVYNERATFREVIGAVLEKSIPGISIEIVIVESNSTDGTRAEVAAVADHPRVTAVFEERPMGKGHAVRTGLAHAHGDFILIQDADLEYSVDDYDRLIEPLRGFEASFVLGRRSTASGRWGMRSFEKAALASRVMNIGHLVFLFLFNAVYRQKLKDPFTMYKVFRRDCIHEMILECDRFDFDWELTAKLIRAGYLPVEVPVAYRSRSFSEGKKIRVVRDPLSWLVACARYRISPIFEDPPVVSAPRTGAPTVEHLDSSADVQVDV